LRNEGESGEYKAHRKRGKWSRWRGEKKGVRKSGSYDRGHRKGKKGGEWKSDGTHREGGWIGFLKGEWEWKRGVHVVGEFHENE
jgi:hypothetical protein